MDQAAPLDREAIKNETRRLAVEYSTAYPEERNRILRRWYKELTEKYGKEGADYGALLITLIAPASNSKKQKTHVEFWLDTLKNNKLTAILIFLAIVLIALAAFTDAVSTIYDRLIVPFLEKKGQ